MKTYLLSPRPELLGHPDWAFSSNSGPVRIEAESEAWARILATAEHLIVGVAPRPKSPWMSGDLVQALDTEMEMLEAA